MKKIVLLFCLALTTLNAGNIKRLQYITNPNEIKVEKSLLYKGKAMESLFTAKFENNKTKRYFEVIKTNGALRDFFLAEFLLVEKDNLNKIIYYPMGWTTDKIKAEEIKANCVLIISGKVSAVKPE
ncbi:MAG: hypothetical protein JNJ40_09685 [Bacteroidia bacterium]|nr:hypothetical protein [Bacteroidia bacterium]